MFLQQEVSSHKTPVLRDGKFGWKFSGEVVIDTQEFYNIAGGLFHFLNIPL
jgi:hypothetical protein